MRTTYIYTNTRTSEVLEFDAPQAAFAHDWWAVEVLEVDDLEDELSDKLGRDVLEERARAAGVEDPEKLPNKGAVIDAIKAKQN